MAERHRMTAHEARERSGVDGWLDKIDMEIEKQCDAGRMFAYAPLEILKLSPSLQAKIADNLASRGFQVTKENNPTGMVIRW